MKYYLRMEGMNLANYVYDTQTLNVIRGGGLLLLYAVDWLKDEFYNKGIRLDPVSTGASSGIFSFMAKDHQVALSVKKTAEDYLKNHSELRHATIMVDVLPDDGDYLAIREKTLAANRWQQMQSLSVAVPSASTHKKGVCQKDLIRPAACGDGPKDNDGKATKISTATWLRHEFGRQQKQDYYKKITELSTLPEFTNNLEELSNGPQYGNLHHKIAFFYADGNKFGKIQLEHCKDEDSQRQFDTDIKGKRKELLTELLKESLKLPGMFYFDNLRFETLLWGGDEMIFVVPAWQGWWLASRFFSLTRDWKFNDTDLTHGASLIFCHHNAPIHRVKSLAYQLADLAKEKSRKENLLAYQVLESFDHLGTSPEQYRQQHCPAGIEAQELILSGRMLTKIENNFSSLGHELPRRRLHKIVQQLFTDPRKARQHIDAALKLFEEQNLAHAVRELQRCFGTSDAFWLHLAELWDYLAPEESR